MTATTRASGDLSLALDLSDEDVRRIAAEIIRQQAALVPHWLPTKPLTQAEAAEWLGVSTDTLRRWAKKGILVPFQADNIIIYTPDQIAEALSRRNGGQS